MDTIVRTIADKLPSLIDRNVVVEYRAGGTGLVASSFMKSTPPDGSHLIGAIGDGVLSVSLLEPAL